VTFTVEGMPAAELAVRLGEQRLGVAAGHFYAARLLEALAIDPRQGALRVSFVHYTHEDEVARLITALTESLARRPSLRQ
jgi:selenocysteine lyase/cysteine desulfurase